MSRHFIVGKYLQTISRDKKPHTINPNETLSSTDAEKVKIKAHCLNG
jgi:hypothetical protein